MKFITTIIIVSLSAACVIGCRGKTSGDEPKPRETSITEAMLYDTDIREIDRNDGGAGVLQVLAELTRRSKNGDKRSLQRLCEISFSSDGYVSEGVSTSLAAVYRTKPEFVLRNVYDYESAKRDLIYQRILYEEYEGLFFAKQYPSNISELRALGEKSKRFLQLYDYYLQHPRDIEDWSKIPPEN